MSAIISTVTAQQWGLLNKPELQAFQKMYDEELLSEGIVIFPVALEHYYPRLGMSKTEFSFMRNLLQLWSKNDKKSWFVQEQIEEIFGKSKRQVQRDARKLAKEGFIIISEWDDIHNTGAHCIHYDCTPFLQMISQLVRVDQHRNAMMGKTSTPKSVDEQSLTAQPQASSPSRASGSNMPFDVNLVPTTPPLSVIDTPTELEATPPTVTNVAIMYDHIHMAPGKKFSNRLRIDIYNPALVAPDIIEQPAEADHTRHQHMVPNLYVTREATTEPRFSAPKTPEKLIEPAAQRAPQRKREQVHNAPAQMPAESSYASQTFTATDREQARQKNQQQTRLPLLSSVVLRETSQAFHDCAPQASQRDTALIYSRLLLINRIEDDLSIKNPDQYFANLIKSVTQSLMTTSKQPRGMQDDVSMMDHFMTELNQAAFKQFEQIKIMRYQRMHNPRRQQVVATPRTVQQPEPLQLVVQEPPQHQLDQHRLAAVATKQAKIQQRARNFPTGEELVSLAQHMQVSMTEEEANEIETGTASEQLLLDIQDAILLSYDQQPNEIANLNYA